MPVVAVAAVFVTAVFFLAGALGWGLLALLGASGVADWPAWARVAGLLACVFVFVCGAGALLKRGSEVRR